MTVRTCYSLAVGGEILRIIIHNKFRIRVHRDCIGQ